MTELKLQQCRLDGRYDVQECLGRGSYAEIYVARDLSARAGDPGTVVIKALNVHLQGEPDAELERTLVANFQNEAIALDRVRHPHIISRLGHGTAIDLANYTFHYLVLEYMAGGDMGARCRREPYKLKDALFYLEQVCAGLALAHSRRVIHRDVKPQNLLLSGDRKVVKIADFGVAKLEAADGVITRVGTNVYAPPEHNPLVQTGPLDPGALKACQHLTPAADIYSLAKTTYTLLAGEPPRRFAHRPVSELPPSLSSEPWSRSVLRVIEQATQNEPSERYQTVEEFWEELRDASLPPTKLLVTDKASTDAVLSGRSLATVEAVPAAPPRPRFESTGNDRPPATVNGKRPRIVVAVDDSNMPRNFSAIEKSKQRASEIIESMPDELHPSRRNTIDNSRFLIRFMVAALLVLCFAGMLLATHYYISRRRSAGGTSQQVAANAPTVGSEGTTATDVNLRPDPGLVGQAVGLAEKGSRVRVMNVRNSALEVVVIQHSRAKADPESSDRGWINRKYVELGQ
jgi:serine/threonine protein kinase